MKKITFQKNSKGEYMTFSFGIEYQDRPTYLHTLARQGTLFQMTAMCDRFSADIAHTHVHMYTDKYGNKILRFT